MAIPVPSAQAATAKWTSRTPAAATDYKIAVQNSGPRWQDAVDNADQAYVIGTQAAIANDSYGRGVQGKGSKYAQKAADIGFQRFGPGAQSAASDFQTGIGRVLGVISGLTLPPRMGTNSPQNYQRSQVIGDALHAAKLAGTV
jgi:hypothetical protein